MAVPAISSTGTSTTSSANASSAAFGLDFQSLLQIILTQLTYQDPLKPMDNFQFVSQLAQFSQLQQTQTLNTSVTDLLTAQSNTQAVSLLGHTIAVTPVAGSTQTAAVTGKVTAVNFSSSQPTVSIQTSDGQIFANISISSISTVQ